MNENKFLHNNKIETKSARNFGIKFTPLCIRYQQKSEKVNLNENSIISSLVTTYFLFV